MKLTITIDCNNDAFKGRDYMTQLTSSINKALYEAQYGIMDDVLTEIGVFDSNGNDVGKLEYK